MDKSKYSEEKLKEIEYLFSNYEMLERTKEEAKLRGTEKSVERIQMAQDDTISQLRLIDPSLVEELLKKRYKDEYDMIPFIDETVLERSKVVLKEDKVNNIESEPMAKVIDFDKIGKEISVENDYGFNNIDSQAQYDIVELPSKGQCYKDKYSRLPVGYLTAYDENFITSPNLYKDGLVIDYLLKHKIMNGNVDIEELCSGDVDAITLFLRVTSYGPEYPIIVTDPDSGKQFETVFDLSQLKIKDFVLEGDENGWFEYELPLSKDKVKFRFLTRKDHKILERLGEIEDYGVKASKIKGIMQDLTTMVKRDDVLNGKEKQVYLDIVSKFTPWCAKLTEREALPYNRMITNRLELSVMSINGETDREFITKYVRNMPARDALMLRRYILENEPGVDFEINVERPESLGGGSFKTFLEWSDTIFFNIA